MRIPDNLGFVQDPNQIGDVILDKLIGDMKSKLPFLNKKKKGKDDEDFDEDEEQDTETETEVVSEDDEKTTISEGDDDETSPGEELEEDNSLVGKIKAKLNSFKKKKDDDEDAEEGDEETSTKKKKPNLVVIAVGIGLIAFIFLSDFGEEEAPAPDPTKLLKPRKDKKPPKEAATETPKEAPKEAPKETPKETAPTETPTVTTAPEETPTETPTETPSPDITTPPDNATVDSVTGEDTQTTDENLTEQILKDLEGQATVTQPRPVKTEYVAPPNYENIGRGLVYNCTGKHWACIDGPSYKTCEDNLSSTKFLKKKIECYPSNVYETQSGCEKMQNRVVSSSAKTDFCNEN